MNSAITGGRPPQVVYSGHTTNWPMLILSIVISVPLIVIGLGSGGSPVVNAIVALLVTASLVMTIVTTSSMRSTIGSSGATVRFGIFGLPRFHWPLDAIERAEAIEISPWSQVWGVWWSPGHGWKLALRSGTAVRLTLKNGRHVTFNVEDSAEAIEAIEAARHA